ncbi:MAG: threonine synthase, partial [Atopobiaceae bacterium]|nr:threonine synthase [Atopobiaceae bacterium]
MSSFYHSTRANDGFVTSKQAIRRGIAPDGGLYVSDSVFDADLDIASLVGLPYNELALRVLTPLLPDFPESELAGSIAAAYASFDTSETTPLSPLGDDWLLELYHGPTCAFKDVALQMLPQLMARSASEEDSENVLIVTATSGDTGKAALDGFADVEGTGVVVFFPDGKVSDVQRLQRVTQTGSTVGVCAVRGNFDDCQSAVKRIFADRSLAKRLAEKGVVLSSANSINVGRLAPQVVYYFKAYIDLVSRGVIACGESIEFCVPTGNFGDVLAGYDAKRMGLPVSRIIVASNSNDVLVDLIRTGVYDSNRPFTKTISPSMDILISS